jgi:DNA primase
MCCAEYVTTTTLNGARSSHKTDFTPLAGRTVWLWPDTDEPGRKYAEAVAELASKAGAREVKLLHVPGDHPSGWDAANALAEGWQASNGFELSDIDPKALIEGLNNKDPGVWFEEKVLEALAILKAKSYPDYERGIAAARKAKVSLKELKKRITDRARVSFENIESVKHPTLHTLYARSIGYLAFKYLLNNSGQGLDKRSR